ncbi:MAG TPA: GNAT family N-acetyltransferase [Pirellulales bacterium]|jgi:GNAT superfamily N-acetyltransferase|nr:GNAT family N-acetyltransferase [Pirellulales bacterium]
MPDPLVIRRYRPEDQAEVMQLHILPMLQVGAYKGEGPWDDDLRQIEKVYCNPYGDFLVGLLHGRMVVMGALRKTGSGRCEIRRVRVHPDFQRQGLGRKIINRLEGHARQLGYHTVHLQTQEIQHAAREFYRRLGYRETRRKVLDGRDYVEFEKVL